MNKLLKLCRLRINNLRHNLALWIAEPEINRAFAQVDEAIVLAEMWRNRYSELQKIAEDSLEIVNFYCNRDN